MSNPESLEIPLGKRSKKYRFFEMLPGIASISLLLLPIVLALINPVISAIFIIIYILTYIMRALAIAGRVIQAYKVMGEAEKINWQQRLIDIANPEQSLASTTVQKKRGWHHLEHLRNLRRIAKDSTPRPHPKDITHVVIIPTANEGREVLEPTVQSIAESDFPNDQTILIIGYEERGPETTHQVAKDLIKEYESVFKHVMVTMHPKDLPGEVIGKGGNITYAAKQFDAWVKEQADIDPEGVIITTIDSDNRPHRAYLSYVAYEFIVSDKRHQRSFQPISLYLNNIWDVPAPMRVLATGNSFWTMIVALRPHMLRNFASHSQSLQGLRATNFWSTRSVVEDGHQFWRSYFAFKGDYEVVPVFVPIYQDAILAETYLKTLRGQFAQLRRWAYGASDIPYIATRIFTKKREVPFFDSFSKLVRAFDGHVSWATSALILALGAWAPLVFGPESSRSIVAQELPQLVGFLQTVGISGLFINIFLSMKMLPPRPERYKRRRTVLMVAQWALMPLTSIVYGSTAALNAQMRLLTGRYLDKFDITDKTVKK